jgi:hypothetical protein
LLGIALVDGEQAQVAQRTEVLPVDFQRGLERLFGEIELLLLAMQAAGEIEIAGARRAGLRPLQLDASLVRASSSICSMPARSPKALRTDANRT